MNRRSTALLLELLRQPTAPFREASVVEFVSATLKKNGVPFFRDPIGNIIVGAGSRPDYARLVRRSSREPLRLYVAHMDHPGFHGIRWLGNGRLQAQWHGGGPIERLVGASVWLADARAPAHHGRVRAARLTKTRRSIKTLEIDVAAKVIQHTDARSLFGGFSFRAPVWRSEQLLYTKAADDLIGVYAILATAIDHKRRKSRAPFLGLLTRAEEVGFIGAIGHFDL